MPFCHGHDHAPVFPLYFPLLPSLVFSMSSVCLSVFICVCVCVCVCVSHSFLAAHLVPTYSHTCLQSSSSVAYLLWLSAYSSPVHPIFHVPSCHVHCCCLVLSPEPGPAYLPACCLFTCLPTHPPPSACL